MQCRRRLGFEELDTKAATRGPCTMPAMQLWLVWLAFVAGAYLVGSIPFGLLLARSRGIDIRTVGSGNIGATNVGRALGRRLGVLCFVLDVAKGAAPVLAYGLWSGAIAGQVGGAGGAVRWIAVAAAAMTGHVLPLWLKFRGGKGVATGLGVTLAMWPAVTIAGLGSAMCWLALVQLTGYVSVGSVGAAMALPLLTAIGGWLCGLSPAAIGAFTAVTAALGGMVVYRHRSNLRRLAAGTEEKVSWAWATRRACAPK